MPIKMMNYLFIYLFEHIIPKERKKTHTKRKSSFFMWLGVETLVRLEIRAPIHILFVAALYLNAEKHFFFLALVLSYFLFCCPFFSLLFILNSPHFFFCCLSGIEKCFISNCRFFWCTLLQACASARSQNNRDERYLYYQICSLFFDKVPFAIEHLSFGLNVKHKIHRESERGTDQRTIEQERKKDGPKNLNYFKRS